MNNSTAGMRPVQHANGDGHALGLLPRRPRTPLPDCDFSSTYPKPPLPRSAASAGPELLDSPLWDLLWKDGHARDGTWVPTWLFRAKAVKTEARALVLARVNWWFEISARDKVRSARPGSLLTPRARARVRDREGRLWWAVSTRELAAQTALPQGTVFDVVNWLAAEKQKLLHALRRGKGGAMFLRLVGDGGYSGVRALYHATTHDQAVMTVSDDEADRGYPWSGSAAQASAFHGREARQRGDRPETALGVTVHKALVPVVGGDPFLARLLSQVLYFFGDRWGRRRAKVVRDGSLWWVYSLTCWAERMGRSPKTVQRGLDRLVRDGLLHRRVLPYGGSARKGPRWLLHVRPDVDAILARVGQDKGVLAGVSERNRQ